MVRFIDLFAGIGGFHQALQNLGGYECVFASEIDKNAAAVYENNHKFKPAGDITKIEAKDIPEHELLCAGFPCQPFSIGGHKKGFEDTRGTLFFDIARIADHHKTPFLILENVPNIVSHDNGNTYKTIIRTLKKLGYSIDEKPLIISPHNLGIPVYRPRTFFLCVRGGGSPVKIDVPKVNFKPDEISSYFRFKKTKDKSLYMSEYELKVLKMWDEFYKLIDIKIVGFPIWYESFFEDEIDEDYQPWKKTAMRKSRELYLRNKKKIDIWRKSYENLEWVVPTHKKFEWQCGADCKGVFDGLIQFRPSGIRVKRLNYFSTLVAMNHPQIVGPIGRRLSSDETKLLQSFPKSFKPHEKRPIALKQFGNAVSVKVVEYLVKKMM